MIEFLIEERVRHALIFRRRTYPQRHMPYGFSHAIGYVIGSY